MALSKIEEAVEAFRNGKMVMAVDDENRENEGDIFLAAEFATPEKIAFFLHHTTGYICVATTSERLDVLEIPMMVENNTDAYRTAFAVTVDARMGTTTGISASDRATTIQLLADPAAQPDSFNKPGHIQVLKARDGGVLERPGHTETGVALAQLAGLQPASVLCEIVTEDKMGMARLPELKRLSEKHGLVLFSIADLVQHQLQRLPHQLQQQALFLRRTS